jgi:ubiquinone/menaquinone biosynthesis C-methylase UbiE
MAHHHRKFPSDDEERRKWQDPDAVLSRIGLEPGMTFADIGCGEGFFAIPAARMVGASGRVYAVDLNAESIEVLKETARREGLENVSARAEAAETALLCEECADMVFFGIDLHDFADAARVLANARAMIKPSGKLIDLDWKKEPMEMGPPLEIRFDEARATGLIEAAGFNVEEVAGYGPSHYMVTASPAPLP